MDISIGVRHNLGTAATRIEAYPEKLNRAMYEGTVRSEPVLKDHIADIIASIAGGVYWDINSDGITRTPTGASVKITTPPSKPHRIEPTKKHGLLVFEGSDGTVFVRGGINHPGSNPVDWVNRIAQHSGNSERIEHIFTDEVGEALR